MSAAPKKAPTGKALLKFRCTSCGNCCKEPLLPVTDADVARIVRHTGETPKDVVKFVSDDEIDLDDADDFVRLKEGKRVMVLRHGRLKQGGRGCRYLGADDRCTIYEHRPIGCRVFPFDADFSKKGKLRRLELIEATDCRYELNGHNAVEELRETRDVFDAQTADYHARIAAFNLEQKARKRAGKALLGRTAFLRQLPVDGSGRES